MKWRNWRAIDGGPISSAPLMEVAEMISSAPVDCAEKVSLEAVFQR